jgi:hypothetical protein
VEGLPLEPVDADDEPELDAAGAEAETLPVDGVDALALSPLDPLETLALELPEDTDPELLSPLLEEPLDDEPLEVDAEAGEELDEPEEPDEPELPLLDGADADEEPLDPEPDVLPLALLGEAEDDDLLEDDGDAELPELLEPELYAEVLRDAVLSYDELLLRGVAYDDEPVEDVPPVYAVPPVLPYDVLPYDVLPYEGEPAYDEPLDPLYAVVPDEPEP